MYLSNFILYFKNKGHSLFLKLLYDNILSIIPQFFRSYGTDPIVVIVVVVNVAVVVHIVHVVRVACVRRGQPDNYALLVNLFSLTNLMYILLYHPFLILILNIFYLLLSAYHTINLTKSLLL